MKAESLTTVAESTFFERAFAGLVLLFPVGMASIRHYSSVLLFLMVLLSIPLAFRGRQKPSRDQFFIVAGLFFLVATATLSFINAQDVSAGFRRLEKLLDLLCLLPLFYGTANCRYDLSKKFLIGLLIAAPINLGVAAHSLWSEGLQRAQGYYNAIIFGDLMMLAAMLLLVYLVISATRESGRRLIGVWLAMFAFLLVVYFSGTRGALLVFPPVIFVLFCCCRKQITPLYLKRLGIPAVIIVLSVMVLGVTYGGKTGLLQRYTAISTGTSIDSNAGHSDSLRIEMWKHAGRLFLQHPLIGTGLGDFGVEIVQARKMGQVKLDKDYTHAHSIYFEYLGMTGVIGFVAMVLALFVIPGFVLMRSRNNQQNPSLQWVGALVVLVCFASFGLTENWLARSSMVASFVVSFAAFFPRSESLGETL